MVRGLNPSDSGPLGWDKNNIHCLLKPAAVYTCVQLTWFRSYDGYLHMLITVTFQTNPPSAAGNCMHSKLGQANWLVDVITSRLWSAKGNFTL